MRKFYLNLMRNKKEMYAVLLASILIIIIIITSMTPLSIDSWNLINSIKANLKTIDYRLYPGVGLGLELLFRGINSDFEFEFRYFIIAILSSIALIILITLILQRYYFASARTAITIGLFTYLMGPFQLGGLYWDYFYLIPILGLMILLNELSGGNEKVNLIYSSLSGILVGYLLIGKQNSATLPLLYLIIISICTSRISDLKKLTIVVIFFIASLSLISEETQLINISMLTDHLTIPFRYSVQTSIDTTGVYYRAIYRLFPLYYAYKFSIQSFAFYIYGFFQLLIIILVLKRVSTFIYNAELPFYYTIRDSRLFMTVSIVGIYFINIITLGRNWPEISTLAPIVTYILINSNSKNIEYSKINKILIGFSIVFYSVCTVIPLRNYIKIYINEYERPYGLLVFGAYATGDYIKLKEIMKLIASKHCVGGIGASVSPLLYLGHMHCSHLIHLEHSIKSQNISYESIIETMQIKNSIFIDSCFKDNNCFLKKSFEGSKVNDFIVDAKKIYITENIDLYISN